MDGRQNVRRIPRRPPKSPPRPKAAAAAHGNSLLPQQRTPVGGGASTAGATSQRAKVSQNEPMTDDVCVFRALFSLGLILHYDGINTVPV
mmetsp:Transcript_35250/g.76488  ORF Transcript_35250/g.76488 Transcript_35250/m.76488 type:complete len:90 (-) Transcript_35250:655-924(-)